LLTARDGLHQYENEKRTRGKISERTCNMRKEKNFLSENKGKKKTKECGDSERGLVHA